MLLFGREPVGYWTGGFKGCSSLLKYKTIILKYHGVRCEEAYWGGDPPGPVKSIDFFRSWAPPLGQIPEYAPDAGYTLFFHSDQKIACSSANIDETFVIYFLKSVWSDLVLTTHVI